MYLEVRSTTLVATVYCSSINIEGAAPPGVPEHPGVHEEEGEGGEGGAGQAAGRAATAGGRHVGGGHALVRGQKWIILVFSLLASILNLPMVGILLMVF